MPIIFVLKMLTIGVAIQREVENSAELTAGFDKGELPDTPPRVDKSATQLNVDVDQAVLRTDRGWQSLRAERAAEGRAMRV